MTPFDPSFPDSDALDQLLGLARPSSSGLHSRLLDAIDGIPRVRVTELRPTYDSDSTPLLTGTRFAGAPEQRSLVYRSDAPGSAIEISFEISEHDGVHTIDGLVLGTIAVEPIVVQLARGGEEVSTVRCDHRGEFVVPDIEAGEYDMVVCVGDHELVIDEILVGDPSIGA
jgi:hypothetical protein